MSDADDGRKTECEKNTENLTMFPFRFGNIELLNRNNPYKLNPEVYEFKLPIFNIPPTPYIRRNDDGIIPCLPPSTLDSFFKQTQLTRNEINKGLLTIHEDLWKMPSGLSIQEYNKKIASSGFTLINYYNKTDNTIAQSFSPGVTYTLVIPEPDVPPIISKSEHTYRNEYQKGYAPRSLDTMRKLENYGFFYLYKDLFSHAGFTKTHNLTDPEDKKSVRQLNMITTTEENNYDYRGVVGKFDDKFEGMQFVYNKDSEKLVVDVLNKGTFDYVSPAISKPEHYDYDFYPWLYWGNVIADDESIYMPQEKEEKIKKIDNDPFLSYDEKQNKICDLFIKKERPRYGKKK